MKAPRHLLMICGIALFGLAILIWLRPDDKDPSVAPSARNAEGGSKSSALSEEAPMNPRKRRERQMEPKPWKASAEVIALYSRLADEGDPHSDLSMHFERVGFTDYYRLMRDAFQGDGESLAMVFQAPPTDGSASESFAVGVTRLLKELGDRYFAHHLSKQSPEVQKRIIRLIWRNEFDSIAAGVVPTVGDQACPETGLIATKIMADKAAPSNR